MGERYIIDVTCPYCNYINKEVYYAPTCNFTTHFCENCTTLINLEEYTGISYEDCSNIEEIRNIVDTYMDELDEY